MKAMIAESVKAAQGGIRRGGIEVKDRLIEADCGPAPDLLQSRLREPASQHPDQENTRL